VIGRLALVAMLAAPVGCGDRDAAPAPPAPATAPAAPGLAPGLELTGPIPPPDRSAAVRRAGATAEPLDLGGDRAFVPIAVPHPPRGGAVRFAFGDDRTGWVTRLPEGLELPAAAYGDGRVYVSGGFSSVTFYALDATTGAIDWATTHLEDDGPTAAVYDDGRVIFNTESCTLFALDARTGKRLWRRYLGDPTLAQIAVADGVVFSAHPTDGSRRHRLSAFRVASGARLWSRPLSGELLVGPVVHGDAVYASTLEGWTYRYERASGRLAWKRRLHATTAPWPAGDELFVSRRAGTREQQIVVSAATGAILREHHAAPGGHLADVPRDLSSWPAVWRFEGSRPVVAGGVRYVAMGGEIRASDANTGETLWVRRDPRPTPARALGSVALAGPQLVLATRAGQLLGLDVDTGYTLWAYDLGEPVVAQPIIARGWVYATTTTGSVIALHVADASIDGWHMFGGNPAHAGPVPPT
jgi:Ca-activated chloride channel homolog